MRANCTQAAQGRGIKRYPEDEPREALRLVMQQPQARRIFNERKANVEPVFSSLRCQQGLNRFRRRGLQAVKREFALHVLAHNLSRAVVLRALLTFLYVVLRHRYELAHEFLALLVHASNPINARTSVGCRTANAHLRQPSEGWGFSRNQMKTPCKYCALLGHKDGHTMPLVTALRVSNVFFFPDQTYLGRIVVALDAHRTELFDLEKAERDDFFEDVSDAAVASLTRCDKINYAAYGDLAPHLHARRSRRASWVWVQAHVCRKSDPSMASS